jgi:hypothetical protein
LIDSKSSAVEWQIGVVAGCEGCGLRARIIKINLIIIFARIIEKGWKRKTLLRGIYTISIPRRNSGRNWLCVQFIPEHVTGVTLILIV